MACRRIIKENIYEGLVKNMKKKQFGIVILGCIMVLGMIACTNNSGSSSEDSATSSYVAESNDNEENKSVTTTSKVIEHYCEADGCLNEGTKSIMGLNNILEYYCATHYKEMEDIVDSMIEDTYTSSFTNKYGTSTTKCAHPGCNNYIASSGDTNCCTTHSKNCGECGCYIDEDAMFCISCIEKAINDLK